MDWSHLERHKQAYERHEGGETYKQIGESMGICNQRAWQLAKRWERHLGILKMRDYVWDAESKKYHRIQESVNV